MNEAFEGILARLAANFQIDTPQEDEEGFVGLEVEELSIYMRVEEETHPFLMILVNLGSYPIHCASEVYREIAVANHMWAGTNGGTLSANTDDHTLMLGWREPMSTLDHNRLAEVLELLVESAHEQNLRFKAIADGVTLPELDEDGNETGDDHALGTPGFADESVSRPDSFHIRI
ncbi:MAG: type III secretion system chaperone [Candidatus Methylacidiphilales bacterium]|nr:type III secretion system chaperone [Candidatus Methylacidiphilales bacterium]